MQEMSVHYQPPLLFQDASVGETTGGGDTSIDIFVDFKNAHTRKKNIIAKEEPTQVHQSRADEFIRRDTNNLASLRMTDKPEIIADTTQSCYPDVRSSSCMEGSTKTGGENEEKEYYGGDASSTPTQEDIDDSSGYHGQLLALQLFIQLQGSNTATAVENIVGDARYLQRINLGAFNPAVSDGMPDCDYASWNASSHGNYSQQQLNLSEPQSGGVAASPGRHQPDLPFQQHALLPASQHPSINLDSVALSSYTALLERQLISEHIHHANQQNFRFLQPNGNIAVGNSMLQNQQQHANVSPFLVAPPNQLFPQALGQLGSPGDSLNSALLQQQAQSAYLLQQQQKQQMMLGLLPASKPKKIISENEPLKLPSTGDGRRNQYVMRPGAVITESQIKEVDVLLERGAKGNRHKGSQLYRRLINERRPLYQELPEASRGAKKTVAGVVVKTLKETGARFIHKKKGQYIIMTDREAGNKTSQALREKRERTMVGGNL
jgi:hypothetical protein